MRKEGDQDKRITEGRRTRKQEIRRQKKGDGRGRRGKNVLSCDRLSDLRL